MSGEDLEDAVEAFLNAADAAFDEYDQGYADADATLEVIGSHVENLRDAVEAR